MLLSCVMLLFGRGRQIPCCVDKQEHDLQGIGDPPFALLGIAKAPAGALCPVPSLALPAEPSPIRCPRGARPPAPPGRAHGL